MGTELDDLKFRIAKQMDVTEFLDVLGWDMFDLVDALTEQIQDKKDDFKDALE